MNRKDTICTPTLSPYEAVFFGGLRTESDFDTVEKIYTAFNEAHGDIRDSSPLWYTLWLLTTCWNAGRIEGIRMERARRNKTTTQQQEIDKKYRI